MVQPRKEQLKNVLTRHSRFDFSADPGELDTVVSDATLYPWTISDAPGGSQEDLPAQVLGAVGPYLIVASDSVSVQRQSDPLVTVVFTAADITAARIAAAINLAVGTDVAFSLGERIQIRSDVIGADSSIVLGDVVPGTFAKMGIVVGSYAGSDAPVRGIVTDSLDARGGYAFLRTPDGKNVVTDCPSISPVGIPSSPRIRADFPGGIPIYARLTAVPNGGNYDYVFKYFASVPTDPEIVTVGGDMSLLDSSDFLTLTFTPGVPFPSVGSFVFNFPTGPGLTRDQVVDIINEEFSKAVTGNGGPSGWANVTGNVGQPFSFVSEAIDVSVDGAAFATISLTSAEVTTADVATAINIVLSGVMTAIAVTAIGSANVLLDLRTLNADGRTASIELRNTISGSGTLEKLGIAPGKYRGPFTAEPFGSDEIRIHGLARGPLSSVTMSGSTGTETRLGFTSGIFVGSVEGEVEVGFPVIDAANPTLGQEVTALVPEVLEFGEVDPAVESVIEQFNVRSSGSNVDDRASSGSVTGGGAASLVGQSRGIPDAGKPVVTNALGLIDMSFLRAARDDSYRFFKKLVRGDFRPGVNSVDALVTDVLETPGAEGHPGTNVGLFTVDVDRPDLLSSRQFRLRFGKLVSAKVPFSVTEVGIAGAEWLVNGQDSGGDGTAFGNATGPMKLLDANTDAAGLSTGGTRFIPLTSAVSTEGDRTLRIMEDEEGNSEPLSLFRQVNGRWSATCGDGTSSFGDFNGTDAIQQAITFYAAHVGGSGFHLFLKAGDYEVNTANGPITVDESEITIEGVSPDVTRISNTDAEADTIVVTTSKKLTLKNLLLRDQGTLGANMISLAENSSLVTEDLEITGGKLLMTDPRKVSMSRSSIQTIGAGVPCMEFVMSNGLSGNFDHVEFLFRDCEFRPDDDNPVTRISALNSAIPITRIKKVLFEDCRMLLLSTTDDGGGSMTGNCGVLELAPNGSDVRTGTDTGVIVDRISYRNCTVKANVVGNTVSCLMHLIPQGNGVLFDGGTEFMGVTRLEIEGGSWLAPTISTLFIPFSVFEVGTVVGTALKADEAGGLFIRNCVMGFEGSSADAGVSMGFATADLDGVLWAGPGDAAPLGIGEFGAWTIGCLHVEILDTKLVGFTAVGGNATFMSVKYHDFKMRGCDVLRLKDSGPGSTTSQFRFRARNVGATFGPGVVVQDMEYEGFSIAGGTPGGIFIMDPNTTVEGVGGADYSAPEGNDVTIDNVNVRGWDDAGSFVTSRFMLCNGFVSNDSVYTGSLNHYQNLTIKNCKIKKMGPLFQYGTASVGEAQSCSNLRILDNEASDGFLSAVYFVTGTGQTEPPECTYFEIKGNKFWGYSGPGILWIQGVWEGLASSNNAYMVMVENQVRDNNTLPTDEQIHISTATFGGVIADTRIQGVIRDNMCGSARAVTDIGTIKMDGIDGVPAVVSVSGGVNPTDHSQSTAPLRGADTGHSTAATDDYYYTSSVLMTKNLARLETP